MSRVRMTVATAAVVSLALAGAAIASASKVTSGSTQITASPAAVKLLADNHITMAPLAPVTASGATFTFPITGGRLSAKTLHGVIRHGGGLVISNATTKVTLRRLTLVPAKRGVLLFATVRGAGMRVCRHIGRHHPRTRCVMITRLVTARIARVTGVTVSNGSATGTVRITAFTARVLNRLAGQHVASAGDVFGTGTTTPTLS